MNITIVIDSLAKGGRERRLIELLKGLKQINRAKIELIILSRRIEYEEVFEMGFPIHILERKPKKDPRVFLRLYRICKRFGSDIIHSWGIMSSIYAIPTAKLLKAKFINGNIYDAPEGMNLFDRRFFRAQLTFPFSDVVVANSSAGLKAYQAPKNRSIYIHNGIATDRALNLETYETIQQRYRIKTSHIVGMVGAFHDRKDYDTYIQAAQLILPQFPDTTFLAIGDGPNLARCKALVAAEFRDRILFPGQVNDVESLINLFDVGVLSTNSAVHGEGISNVIMEYMLLGKPVVATTGGGTPEIIREGETGFLVEPASPVSLANKISYLLEHPEFAVNMGKKAADLVRNEFSLKGMVEHYVKLYRKTSNLKTK